MPTDVDRATQLSWLAFAYSLAGERRDAVASTERALSLLPHQGGVPEQSEVRTNAVIAFTQAGDRAAALQQVPAMLAAPNAVKPSGYWCDPMLAPLRSDPAFRQLMASAGANVSIDPTDPATWPHFNRAGTRLSE